MKSNINPIALVLTVLIMVLSGSLIAQTTPKKKTTKAKTTTPTPKATTSKVNAQTAKPAGEPVKVKTELANPKIELVNPKVELIEPKIEVIQPIEPVIDLSKPKTSNKKEDENFTFSNEHPITIITPEPKVFTFVDEEAEFPGGKVAMQKFLSDNILLPTAVVEQQISGKVYTNFVVSSDGTISKAMVIRGMAECPECDKEAVRLIQSMPKWKPGKNSGKVVNSYYNLPISFKPN